MRPRRVRAELTLLVDDGEQPRTTTWRRSRPLEGYEVWRLDALGWDHWLRQGDLPEFSATSTYALLASSTNREYTSRELDFTSAQLAALDPGTFLVPRRGAAPQVVDTDRFLSRPCSW